MKVLYIFDEDDKYGASKAGVEMIVHLREKYNIIPIVITSKKNKVNEFCRENKIENYVTGHRKFTYCVTSSKFKSSIKWLPRYVRYIMCNYIAIKKVKKYIDIRNVDLIHSNNSGIDLGIKLSKIYGKKNIIHIREFGPGNTKYNVKSYKKNYIREFNLYSSKLIVISKALKEFWLNKGIKQNNLKVVYDGIELNDIENKEKWFIGNKINIVMIGSISSGKGQCDLVKAINLLTKEELEKISVDIIGDGQSEEVKKVKELIKKYNLSKTINLIGYRKDIGKILKEYDIGILCSDAEGFGRVTVEYMAAGLCPIVSNKGANIELVKNDFNGLIYKKDDINDLVRKIRFIINDKNSSIVQKIGKNAKNETTKYNLETCVENIMSLYKELIGDTK